jgi:hypothetical protein
MDWVRKFLGETPAAIEAAIAVTAGGGILLIVGPAFALGSLPPQPGDSMLWWALLWVVVAAALIVLAWGVVRVSVSGATSARTAWLHQPYAFRSPLTRKAQSRYRPAPEVESPLVDETSKNSSPHPLIETKKDGRVPLDVTPGDLWALFDGRTDLQGKALALAYVDKWMAVEGPLGDVSEGDLSHVGSELQATFAAGTYPDFRSVYMHVRERRSMDLLAAAKPGDQIVVLGRMKWVSKMSIHLEDCELLRSEMPPNVHPPVPHVPRDNEQSAGLVTLPLSSSAAKALTEDEQKQPTEVTPEELWDLYKGRMEIEAIQDIEPFIGQRMTVSGSLGDISVLSLGASSEAYGALVTFANISLGRMILLSFEREWIDRLRQINQGTRITVRGSIKKVSRLRLDLESCEITKIGP